MDASSEKIGCKDTRAGNNDPFATGKLTVAGIFPATILHNQLIPTLEILM